MGILSSLFGKAPQKRDNTPKRDVKPVLPSVPEHISATPDLPCPFGYKTCWIAVKSDDSSAVIARLTGGQAIPANWESGLTFSGMDDYVFVTPPVQGYVAVVGVGDYDAERPLLAALAGVFEDVQFFGSHHVVDYYCWARYQNGALTRAYCYIGESGEVPWNEGEPTAEENALGFARFPAYTAEDRADLDFPDEESVIAIAGAWGMDPAALEEENEVSSGYLCEWPD